MLLLAEALFGRKVLVAGDCLYPFQPWSQVAPEGFERAANPELLDQAIAEEPWLHFATERVRAGELPLWNPHNYLGHPFLAANSGAVFWPQHWLEYAFPSKQWWEWSSLARLWLAGAFTVLLLLRMGTSHVAAVLGGIAFSLSAFLVTWLFHPIASVACVLPLLLWQVEGLGCGVTRRRVAGLAATFALALLAGYLQAVVHVGLLAAGWGFARARLRGVLAVAGAAALGGLLAAPQLLPFAEYLLASQAWVEFARVDTVGEVPLPEAALLLVHPFLWGAPHRGTYEGPVGHNLTYPDLVAGYVGVVALLLAIAGALRGRRGAVLGGLVLVCALLAWKVEPLYAVWRALPVLGSSKTPRLLLLVAFGLSLLAALGLDGLRARLPERWRVPAGFLACLLVAAELLRFGFGFNTAIEPEEVHPPTPTTDFLRAQPGLFRVLGGEQTFLFPQANLPYGISLVAGYDSLERRETTELLLGLASVEPDFPFVSRIPAFYREEAIPLGSLLNVRYVLAGTELPPPFELAHEAEGLFVYENPNVLPRAFVARDATVVEDPDERLARLHAADFDPWTAVLEEEPDDPLWPELGGEGEVRVISYEPTRIVLEADLPQPALVVLTDAWDPGWRCDDRDILRVDHALRGVLLPSGRSEVEMSYLPTSLTAGILAAALGFVSLLILLLPERSIGAWVNELRRGLRRASRSRAVDS